MGGWGMFMILKCLGVCELNLQICNFAQKQQICHRNSKYAPAEKFVAIFAFAEGLPTSATLLPGSTDWEQLQMPSRDTRYPTNPNYQEKGSSLCNF